MSLINFISIRFLKSKFFVSRFSSMVSIFGISFSIFSILLSSSIYNGLEFLFKNSLKSVSPDIKIVKNNDENFEKNEDLLKKIKNIEDVSEVFQVFEEFSIVKSSDNIFFVKIKYIYPYKKFYEILKKYLIYNITQEIDSSIGVGIFDKISKKDSEYLYIIFFDREKNKFKKGFFDEVSIKKIKISSVFSIQTFIDDFYIFSEMKDFSRISSIDIYIKKNKKKVMNKIFSMINEKNMKLITFEESEKSNLRFINLEKKVIKLIFILVFFISIFSSNFNSKIIFLKKFEEIKIMKFIGFSNNSIRKIFFKVNFFIGTIGIFLGSILFFIFYFLQKKFKFISLGGNIGDVDYLFLKICFFDFIFLIFICFFIFCVFSYFSSKNFIYDKDQ
jgi:lipoprotein-releasing system permease protein